MPAARLSSGRIGPERLIHSLNGVLRSKARCVGAAPVGTGHRARTQKGVSCPFILL
jgi:hypothetical protein